MRCAQRITIAAAIAAMLLSGAPALAQGYGGNAFVPDSRSYTGAWPVTVTGSQRSNGTGCLTLNGTAGGGRASLVFGGEKYTYGSFYVLNGILVATIIEALYGQNGALMFIASAGRGRIGQGAFENVEGGSDFDFGSLAFGTRNGC